MCPLAMCVPESRWESSVPIDLFTAFALTSQINAVEATDNSPAVPEHTTVETPANMSPKNKAHFLAEKEAIHLILTGIRDDIYSTVDACQIAQEMWEAIERLQQGESLNIHDVKTNLFWEFRKFTSKDGETMESYYTRFYKLMNEMIRNNLTVTTMQVNVQFLQQLQLEWSRSSAPSPKPLIPSRSHTSTRHKGKEIAKLITPLSETVSKKDNDHEQAQRDKDIQKNLALIAKYFKKIYKPTNNNLRTSLNFKNKNVDTTPRYKNDDHSGQFGNQRTEKMLLCKQAEQGVPLQAEQYDWLADTDEEVDEQELEAHYSYMAKIQEAQSEIPCLYAYPYDQSTHTNRRIPDGGETLALERKSRPKLNKDSVRPYDYTKLNSLYEIFKPPPRNLFRAPTALDMEVLIQTCLMPLAIKTQSDSLRFVHELKQEMHVDLKYIESLEKEIDELESEKAEFSDMYDVILQDCVSKDVMYSYLQSLSDLDALAKLQCKNDTVCNEKASNVFRNERVQYFKIQDLKAQMQDKNIAISELKKLIEKGKGKSVDTKFDRPSVVRQPNAQRIPKPSVLGKPTPFSNSLERRFFPKNMLVSKANVSEGLSKPVTAQTLPQAAKKAVSNTNVLKPGMYRIDNRTAHTKAPQLP
nr:hypothetical protein [Tanacetum cinerariifolium]